MEVIKISAESRENVKNSGSVARKAGKVPGVLYGGGENHTFVTNKRDLKPLIYTPDFKLAELEVGGKTHKAIIKDLQFHPVTDELMHVDLLKLVDGHTVKLEVPVKFTGTSPGVKSGGKLIQQMRRIKIKTTPENIVDHLELDISELELGSAIRVRDIKLAEGVEIMNNGATPVATVEIPRVLKSAATAEAKEARKEGGAEGEAEAETTEG